MKTKQIALLKLASAFTDKKEVRAYCTIINVCNNTMRATNGYIAIEIQSQLSIADGNYSANSIDNVYKTGLINLLEREEENCKYPEFRFFNLIDHSKELGGEYLLSNEYTYRVSKALHVLSADLGIKLLRVAHSEVYNGISASIQEIRLDKIIIKIAIMPLKQ